MGSLINETPGPSAADTAEEKRMSQLEAQEKAQNTSAQEAALQAMQRSVRFSSPTSGPAHGLKNVGGWGPKNTTLG
jgi:hypothetical protein